MKKIKNFLRDKKFFRNILYTIYIVLTVFILFSLLKQPLFREFFSTMENKTFDVRQNIIAQYKSVSKDIVIISVDEQSYEYLEQLICQFLLHLFI